MQIVVHNDKMAARCWDTVHVFGEASVPIHGPELVIGQVDVVLVRVHRDGIVLLGVSATTNGVPVPFPEVRTSSV